MVVLDPEHLPDVVSDASLVADAQRGSTGAFAELYARHHDRIVRHCRSRIGGNDAADAAQETFLRAWRAIDGFGGDQRVYPWLRTIATNVCIDILRRRGRSLPMAEVEVAPVEDEVLDLTAVTIHADAVTEALARLSDRHRSVLQLREYEGWTYERIADHEQLDLSAVKSLLWRARQSLRREFLLVSAQGRLSALAGLLSFGRLRSLLAEVTTGSGSVAAGSATAAAAVAAAVAVPALVPGPTAPPPTPPPAVAIEAAPAAAPPPATGARIKTVVARAGAAKAVLAVAVATTVPPSTTTTTVVVAPAATTTSTTSTTEAPHAAVVEPAPAKEVREVVREQVKEVREAAKEQAKALREEAKAQAESDREAARAAEKAQAKVERDEERVDRKEARVDRKDEARAVEVAAVPEPTTVEVRDEDHDDHGRGKKERS